MNLKCFLSSSLILLLFNLTPLPTSLHMIINNSNSLHICIDDRRSDKTHSSFLKIFRESIRKFSGGWNFAQITPLIHDLLSVHSSPEIVAKWSELFLYLKKYESILSYWKNFQLISYNLSVLSLRFKILISQFSTQERIKSMKRWTIPFTFVQNCTPAKSCLSSF